ncbi:uncharacterized protein Dvir_GJ26603 [Drosophila virilis]|uniref:Uncharacterized protein n=1 Tax=Drosophila virilis TaxID=7244 RepID=A0A0Q9VYT4_DROVI|nr:uncharacterized protein LOC26531373 [Drosophila virilis]KRF77993.1 uncharacterized protein Dvir_GJ26603 [Drosophila virilis]
MDLLYRILQVLIVVLYLVCYVLGACNDGFYARNGNLVIDLNNLQAQFDCVQQQHRG